MIRLSGMLCPLRKLFTRVSRAGSAPCQPGIVDAEGEVEKELIVRLGYALIIGFVLLLGLRAIGATKHSEWWIFLWISIPLVMLLGMLYLTD